MNMSNTYFEINLEKEQRINELKTLYTVDELINHCYEEEYRNKMAIEYIKSFYETPEYIDAYDITYWTDKVMEILNGGDE